MFTFVSVKENKLNNMKRFEDLNIDELWSLRKQVTLGSIYNADYNNDFNFDEHCVAYFFDGYLEYLEELSDYYYHDTYEFNAWCETEGVLPSDIMFGDEAVRERLLSAYKDYCKEIAEENAENDDWNGIIMEV